MEEPNLNDYEHPISVLNSGINVKLKRHQRMLECMGKYGELAARIADDLALAKIHVTSFEPTDTYDITFNGTKQTYVEFARIMGKHGLRASRHLPEQPTPYWSTFWLNEAGDYVVYGTFSSTICKRVKVGTKTVEQDVYEIRCDG